MNHDRALLGIVGWPNRASRFGAIAGGLLALFASGSASAQCTVTVQGTPVAGAAYYELFSVRARYCNIPCHSGQALWEVPGSAELVATSATPQWVVSSAPEFDGGWKVVAHSANGATVGSAITGPVGLHAAVGAPFLATGTTLIEACVGEIIVLRPRIRPTNVQYHWSRDGVAIGGATESELSVDVEQSHAGAVYSCIVFNACGSRSAGPFLIDVSAGVAVGVVDWRSCVETQSVTSSGGYWYCSAYSTTTTRQGSCNALLTTLTPDGLSIVNSGESGSKNVSATFVLAAPARLQFTSVGYANYCVGNLYNNSSATLTGPVGANLRPSLAGGSGTIDLPAGQYVITTSASQGSAYSCGQQCTPCGPTCLTICWGCGADGNIALTVSFTPLPFDVPDVYPTIQAAIDAAPVGQHETVTVAPGVRNESFSLNGKDVLILGAANNATILDGTGLTTSIARFTGGEPATAGVESLVFRNGIVGSRFTPKSTFTIGGALYGVNSAAAIRNCRFEQNIADFGGGVYLLRCAMNVVDSDFAGNTARDEGGGMQVYETTGVVSGCDFTQNLSGAAGPGSGSGFKAVGAHAAGETVLLTGCTFAGGISGVNGSAVEYYENTVSVPGILRMSGCAITGNSSGLGAGGLRVIGGMYSCVLTGGTSICFNTTSNVDGPYLIEGSATVCDCLADLTHDGAVNGGDLGVLLSNWGLTLPSGAGDVNHDGVVNGADLALLLGSWGVCN